MKITGTPKIQEVYGVNKPASVKSINRPEMGKDTLSVSGTSKEYGLALRHLKSVPDVRKDLVEGIKEQIGSGNYNVSGEQILENIENNSFDLKV